MAETSAGVVVKSPVPPPRPPPRRQPSLMTQDLGKGLEGLSLSPRATARSPLSSPTPSPSQPAPNAPDTLQITTTEAHPPPSAPDKEPEHDASKDKDKDKEDKPEEHPKGKEKENDSAHGDANANANANVSGHPFAGSKLNTSGTESNLLSAGALSPSARDKVIIKVALPDPQADKSGTSTDPDKFTSFVTLKEDPTTSVLMIKRKVLDKCIKGNLMKDYLVCVDEREFFLARYAANKKDKKTEELELLDDDQPLLLFFPANSYTMRNTRTTQLSDRDRAKSSQATRFNFKEAAQQDGGIVLALVHKPPTDDEGNPAPKANNPGGTKKKSDEDYWYYIYNNKQHGPVSKAELLKMLHEQKRVNKGTYVWNRAFLQDWTQLEDAMFVDLLEGVVDDDTDDGRAKRRTKILKEIIETERTYVGLLTVLLESFWTPLQPGSSDILNSEEHSILFSNIELIHATNKKFQEDLETRLRLKWFSDPHCCVGDILLNFIPFFRMYSQYVNNHEKATELLRKLKDRSKFQKMVEETLLKKKISSLNDLLILPIQRVPRYQLLLTEFVKYTPNDHPDYPNLVKSLDSVKNVAAQINDAVRAQRQAEYIRSVEEKFDEDPKFLAPDRRFVFQGALTKRCRRKDVEYEFLLFNNLLVYAEAAGARYKLHRKIPIDAAFRVQDITDSSAPAHSFEIHNSYHSFLVYAATPEDKDLWIKHLQQCEKWFKKTVNGAKNNDLAFSRPVWKPDKAASGCRWCGSKFTVIHRRHHCRGCGSLVCGNCSKQKHHLDANHPEGKEERVCDKCYSDLSKGDFAAVQQRSRENGAGATVLADEEDDEESEVHGEAAPPAYGVMPSMMMQQQQQLALAAAAAAAATRAKAH